jgi:hypothetical protein
MLEVARQNPALAQRVKRVWTAFQSPNRSGKSRQGMPVRYRYRIRLDKQTIVLGGSAHISLASPANP